ncbi:MAG: hypothetical protein IPG06_18275 [Haliea sp.]|nr:hypothetical protein [Haliea sp.]
MNRSSSLLLLTCLLISLPGTFLTACSDSNNPNAPSPDPALAYVLPGDIPDNTQIGIDHYSWQTFLALNAPEVGARVSLYGDNPTQYSAWSSTYDLIRCNLDDEDCVCPDGDCARSGTRYYPPECQAVENHTQYRVLDNANKADDSFSKRRLAACRTNRYLRHRVALCAMKSWSIRRFTSTPSTSATMTGTTCTR